MRGSSLPPALVGASAPASDPTSHLGADRRDIASRRAQIAVRRSAPRCPEGATLRPPGPADGGDPASPRTPPDDPDGAGLLELGGRRPQRGAGRHDVVDDQDARRRHVGMGPERRRVQPGMAIAPGLRDRRHRSARAAAEHGTPSWRATWRATSSAWSKPRSRRRRRLVGAHVTTSTAPTGRDQPVHQQPGEVPGDRPPVAVLEAEQHVADPARERGGDHDAVGRLRAGPADEREPAGPTDRGAGCLAAGAAGREDHALEHDEGVRG